jgi:hypothetical protein
MRRRARVPGAGRSKPDSRSMAWVESVSPSFRARHESEESEDVERALEALERLRDRLGRVVPRTPGDVEVVFHASEARLDLATPLLPLARRRDAPAARRYRAGAARGRRIDVLSPAALRARASGVPGSRMMLELTPAALYARLALAQLNPALARPWHGAAWAWLREGTGAWLGGQVGFARPAIARRLHEGPPPSFPPRRADALLLGGTVLDLVAAERGTPAVVELALAAPRGSARAAAGAAFPGRTLRHTDAAWRSHLARLAGRADQGRAT